MFPLDRLCLVQSAQLSHEVCGPQNSHLPDEEIEAERLNKLLYNPKVAEEFHSVTLEVIFLTAPLTCSLLLLPGRDTWGGCGPPYFPGHPALPHWDLDSLFLVSHTPKAFLAHGSCCHH